MPGISLFMQSVQDLTLADTVSRTQYQFILEEANADELAVWGPKLLDKLSTLPEIADVSSDQQNSGL